MKSEQFDLEVKRVTTRVPGSKPLKFGKIAQP